MTGQRKGAASFCMFYANCIGRVDNCRYPHHRIVSDVKSLKEVVSHDYVCAEYKDNYRGDKNFIRSNCVCGDVDNDHSDNPEEWVLPKDLVATIPDVPLWIHYSRNHMKVKRKGSMEKTARPRWHFGFLIDKTTSAEEYCRLKQQVAALFPYIDQGAMDAARFFIGTADPQVELYPGTKTLNEFLASQTNAVTANTKPKSNDKFVKDDEIAALIFGNERIPYGVIHDSMKRMGIYMRGRLGWPMERVANEMRRIHDERCDSPDTDNGSNLENIINWIDKHIERGVSASEVFTPVGLQSFADVEYEEPRFLIKPYLPIGKLTMLQGDPGQGKTAFLCKLAALVSRGDPLIDIPVQQGNVLLLSVEDDPGTLRGRIEASGGDPTRCFFVSDAYKLSFETLGSLEALVTENQIKLIAFDPIQAFLGRGMDMNKANETRPVLAELAAMADRIGCAVLLIAHMNKGLKDSPSVYRALGSVDIVGAMRSGLQVTTHIRYPGMVFVFQYKSSNAAAGQTIEFTIGERGGVSLSGFSPLREKDFREQNSSRFLQKLAKLPEAGKLVDACQKVLDEHPDGTMVIYSDLDFIWPENTNPWSVIASCKDMLGHYGIYVEGPKKKSGHGAVLIQPMKNREGAGL